MVPAFGGARARRPQPTRRLGIVYVPNGIVMKRWTPQGDATALDVMPTLEPLAPFRDRIVLITGLSNKQGDALPGEGAGDHARASGAYLTGVHPKKTEGADLRAGVSMDQIAAGVLGQDTELASLELSLESREPVGACDPGYSCAYANTLCWRSPTTPLPMENDPRVVFERLFGGSESTDPAVWRAAAASRTAASSTRCATRRTGCAETSGRPIARSSTSTSRAFATWSGGSRGPRAAGGARAAGDRPAGRHSADSFEEHAKLMFDLQVLAYQADLTRVITFMVGHETSQRAYPEIGVPDAHHPLSHHGGDREKIEKLTKVNTYHTTDARLLPARSCSSTPDGDGSLLDHLTLLYGSGMSDGNNHNHHDLPTLLVGGGAGTIKGGRHLRYPARRRSPTCS